MAKRQTPTVQLREQAAELQQSLREAKRLIDELRLRVQELQQEQSLSKSHLNLWQKVAQKAMYVMTGTMGNFNDPDLAFEELKKAVETIRQENGDELRSIKSQCDLLKEIIIDSLVG